MWSKQEGSVMERVEIREFRNFKEKIAITKKYFRAAKMEIIDNKYVYIKFRKGAEDEIN